MDKNELLKKFKELDKSSDCTSNNCGDCNDCSYCNYCNYCNYCHNCYNCYNCHNCYNCLLCKNLNDKTNGYWLLNKEVTKEEFEDAKKAMGYCE